MDLAQTLGGTTVPLESAGSAVREKRRIFLLSPADSSGVRAGLLLREEARFDLATRLRESGAPLGEIFSFMSGLYFRGKLAYARAFAEPIIADGLSSVLIITASRGLLPPEVCLRIPELKDMASVPITASDLRYRVPLERDAAQLASQLGADYEVVLLGSIATPKYVDPLLSIFGDRLVFPADFVGRGDMSRGGLMLRSVREGIQLAYTPVTNATRHGVRPPKLAKSFNESAK
ncbi:MAG TPA: hypothetical protein VIY66_08345 [Candidatus Acidoferrales bacterium]